MRSKIHTNAKPHPGIVTIAFIGEDLTLTPDQEFRETRDWLAQHKRDPFLWLIILMPLTLAAFNFGATIVLAPAFPRTDAKRAIEPVSPSLRIVEIRRFYCELPHGKYLFGYDLAAINEQGKEQKVGVYAGTFLKDNGFGLSTIQKNLDSRTVTLPPSSLYCSIVFSQP